jgi:two-component system, NtrC family, nitrogen regulation sensor histidine kinase NtrY
MGFRNFKVQNLIRVLLLSASIYLLLYTIETRYQVAPIILGFAIIFQVYSLFRYIDKTNRDLASFLESIRFSEFTRSFHAKGMGSSFEEVSKAFNAVIRDFQEVRSEKEEHYHYLQSILQNIDVSILVYQKDGQVEMVNKAAKQLFQQPNLKNIYSLEPLSQELVQKLIEIKAGESALVKVQDEEDILQLAIHATEFKVKNKLITLATIKNIQSVLEEQETEAWQKLIRVLTHEIMNSITPISSLSATLENMLRDITSESKGEEDIQLGKDTIGEIQQALQTIHKRSNGLLHFVNTYRNLTRIPKPNFKLASIGELFGNILHLLEEDIRSKGIEVTTRIEPEGLDVFADEQLIEQVLINLVKNSIHALEGRPNPAIQLHALYNKRGRVTIQVTDNGQGILKDVLDKIFIPFFTTKPSGSGIGLSLSRQIMRLHNGTISAYSKPEEETTFILTF